MKPSQLSAYSPKELLQLSGEIIRELKTRGICRTGNNPLSDYTEWLVAKAYSYTLAPKSEKGHDAVDGKGKRIEIKARRVTRETPSRQLSSMRDVEGMHFDEVVAVIFNESYDIVSAMRIPREVVLEMATYKEHTNSHVLNANGALINHERVENITEELNVLIGELI